MIWFGYEFISQTSEDRSFSLTLIHNGVSFFPALYAMRDIFSVQDIFALQDFSSLEISLQEYFFS